MEKKTRFEIRLSSEERLKLSALSAQSKLSESEVLRTLITNGSVIEVEKNNRVEGLLDDMSIAVLNLINLVGERLEAIESVLIDHLSSAKNTNFNSALITQNNQSEIPTLDEFEKSFSKPQMPSQLQAFKEMVKSEYKKQYGVSA